MPRVSISSGKSTGVDEPPGTTAFEFAPAANAAGYLVDHLLEVVTHGQLVDAGALDVAADAEQARAAVALRAHGGVGLRTHLDDVRHGGDGLGVVDDRRPAVEADHGRERRLNAGNAALAFERLHQRRLLAHFVSAGAGLGDDVELCAGLGVGPKIPLPRNPLA